MSELQKEILSMVIMFDNDILLSMKPLLEKLLDSELLKLDTTVNLESMDIYDKIDTLKAVKVLNNNSSNISYDEALKQLGLESDEVWNIQ